jgi:hypothetical protein
MTYTTYFPDKHTHQPCHHHQHMRPQHDAAAAAVSPAAATARADARAAAAVSGAWQRAQQLAARLDATAAETSAHAAFEAEELLAELEATMDSMERDTQDAEDADDTAAASDDDDSDVIDHRWDLFDSGLWSQAATDAIDPAREYDSSSSLEEVLEVPPFRPSWLTPGVEYEPTWHFAPSAGGDDAPSEYIYTHEDLPDIVNWLRSNGLSPDGEQEAPALLPEFPAPQVPARLPSTGRSQASSAGQHQHRQHPQQQQVGGGDIFDIGVLASADNIAADNLALFGVRTPEEVAAAAAAARPAVHFHTSSSSWANMLEMLSTAQSPSYEAQQAAAVLLVGCTLMVFIMFLFSVADLRAAVAGESAAAAAASAAAAGSSKTASFTPVRPLRTCKPSSAFAGCSAIAAAAVAAVGGGCGVQCAPAAADGDAADDLSMPLLLDCDDDIEAAVLEPRAAAVLPPALQKFYNPMHYQQLPDSE